LIAKSVGNEIVKTCSWGELFVSSCENIIKGSDVEFQIRSGMSGWITGDQENRSVMSDEQFNRIKFRFVGRRLVVIELVSRTYRGENREVRVWKLTDYGQAQYGLLMP